MDIRLYIDNMQVDLNDDNLILFNWQEMDTSNPTIIKNGYSKTITLQGTESNNEIFGHFWNLERYQAGDSFNPSYRVPFVLYYNGAVYERGYVKLQKVIKENKTVKYEISLFGGLGSFIYNLSTNWNTGEKKNLSDLNFFGLRKPKIYSIDARTGGTGSTSNDTGSTVVADDDTDFSFTINADTVKTAWENIKTHPKWSMINFAPTYAGLPDNLDSDKVLINFNQLSTPELPAQLIDDSGNYRTYGGYALGKLPDKLTSEEVKDYRSYIQTPVVRVKSIFDAICMKENNKGKYDNGYEVILDDDFFNDKNPYYYDSWITLPQLSLKSVYAYGETEDWGDATPISTYTGDKSITYVFRVDNNTSGSKVKIKTKLRMNIDSSQFGTFDSSLFLAASAPWGPIGTQFSDGALAVQAYASNSINSIERAVDGSKINWLTNSYMLYPNGGLGRYSYADAVRRGFYTNWLTKDVTDLEGWFVKRSTNVYEWVGTNDGYIEMETDVPANTQYLKICIQLVPDISNGNLYIKNSESLNLPSYKYTILRQTNLSLIDKDIVVTKLDNQNTYSNRVISKDILLNTTYSPAEFLISYCKTFGLHLYKDIVEDKIYIRPRNKFYDRENIIDINDKIDYSKPIEINPVYVDTNYVSLSNEVVDGISNKDYKDKYGKIFGQKIVDTGFEFNADTKELNSGSVLKNAIQTKEQSQYFYLPDSKGINPYVYNGFTYSLYKDGQSDGAIKTIEVSKKVLKDTFTFFEPDFPFYDILGKPQFEDDKHKGLDTEGVMLFFTGKQDVTDKGYYLTDDNSYMNILNNNPCWLMTNSEYDAQGTKIASKITELPRFSRYYEGNKYMIYSWDYGSPRELYIPDMQNNEEGNIYHLYFKNYLTDLYDINTKVVTCFVKVDGILTEEYLRRIYWFDNAIWRLNRVYDYNPNSPNTTKCEFIKIQDMTSFDIEEASTKPWVKIYLDMYYIGQTGGTIIGTVRTWNNYGWSIESIEYDPSNPLPRGVVTVTPETYGQSGNFTLTVPSNIRDYREVTINVKTDDDGSGSVSFRQPGVEYSFGFNPAEFSGGTLAYTGTLNITNPYYYDWNISSKPDWISITPSSVNNGQYGETGNTACTLTMSKNTTEVERTGIVTISETTYGNNYTFPVKQAGYEFSVSPNSLSFNKSGEAKTVTITNPYGYSWIVDSKPDWITTAKTGGNLIVTAAKNIVFERTGTVVIKDTDFNKTYTISVTQESGYVFSISPSSFNFEQDGDTNTLTIDNPNEMNWIITNYPAWVTISPTGGTGTSVTVGAIKNTGLERSALTITVTETLLNRNYYFDITQESGYDFSLSPTSLSFEKSASNKQFYVQDDNGYDWEITNIPDWLTVNVRTGNSTTLVTVSATKNVNVERSANLIIKETTWGFDYTLSVTQASGYEFSVIPVSFAFVGDGESKTLSITNPNGYSWELEEMPYWVSANQTTGNSDATITLTAVANGGAARTGEFIVSETTFSNQTTISVTQESGYTFSISPYQLYFAIGGEGKTITITNPDNYNWTASSNVNWLTLSQLSGNRSATITATAGDNSAGEERYGKVTIIDTTYNKTYEIDIEQEGFEFFVTPTAFTFNSTGGTQELSIIDNNEFEWEIISYPSWIVPAFTTGNTSIGVNLTARDNSGSAARSGVLKVKEKAFNNEFSVSINQESGVYFSVSPVSFSFIAAGESKTLSIDNPYNYSWTIEELPYWISVNATAGTSSETITLTATRNGDTQRTGTFMVSCNEAGGTDISVLQEAYTVELTGITIDNLTWVTDIPAAGGTATKSNCSYTVTAHYSDGTTTNITNVATITGSLNVASSTNTSRHSAGTLTLTASYSGFTNSASVTVYQAAYVPSLLTPRIISIDAYYEETPDPTPSGDTGTTYTVTYNMATTGAPLAYGGQIEVWLGAEGSQQGQASDSHNYIINNEGEMVEQSQSLNATISGSVVTFGCTVDIPTTTSGIITRIEISYGSYSDSTTGENAFINIPISAISSSTTGQVNIYFTR